MPCVTPRGEFYHIGEHRYLTGMAHTHAYHLPNAFQSILFCDHHVSDHETVLFSLPLMAIKTLSTSLPDVEKLLFQSFPLQDLSLQCLTKRDTWQKLAYPFNYDFDVYVTGILI